MYAKGDGIYNNQGHQERGAKEAVCPGPIAMSTTDVLQGALQIPNMPQV